MSSRAVIWHRVGPLSPLALAVLVLACGSGSETPEEPAATDSLLVLSVAPVDGSTGVDPLTPLALTFNHALDPGTLTGTTVMASAGGASTETSRGYIPASPTLTVRAPLQPGMAYHVTVNATLAGSGGETLFEPFQWDFTTATWTFPSLGSSAVSRGLALQRGAGGMLHLASWSPAATGDSLRYSECSTACDTPASWSHTNLLVTNTGGPVALAVDATGTVHLAYQDASSADIIYARCSSGCAVPTNWSFSAKLDLAASEGYATVTLQVDATGRLHLATGVSLSASYGVAYATCAATCLTAANWDAVVLDSSITGTPYPSLAVSPTGEVSLLIRAGAGGNLALHSCAGSCLSPGNWQSGDVGDAEVQARPALLRTADGTLHTISTDETGSLSYARCPATCLSSGSWLRAAVEPPGSFGPQVALTISRQGRVHALYADRNTDNLRYASCTTTCTTAANWTESTVLMGGGTRLLALIATDDDKLFGAIERSGTGTLLLLP